MTTRDKIMDGAALLAVCCLVVLITRSFLGGTDDRGRDDRTVGVPELVDDWEALLAGGHHRGSPTAPVTIVTFVDFQCPACRVFALGAERSVRDRYPRLVRWIVRNLPLQYHRLAYPAAKAAECAGRQDQFETMYNNLFEKQDSLGLKSFREFATESGVDDLQSFDRCMSNDDVDTDIDEDIRVAGMAGARGTPTVIINGLRLGKTPNEDELLLLVGEELHGHGRQSR